MRTTLLNKNSLFNWDFVVYGMDQISATFKHKKSCRECKDGDMVLAWLLEQEQINTFINVLRCKLYMKEIEFDSKDG